MLTTLGVSVFAESQDTDYTFCIDGIEVIVKPDEKTTEDIAYKLAYAVIYDDIIEGTRGAWCTINGHTMSGGNVTKVDHRYYSSAPRCLRRTYYSETCLVCGYSTSTLLSSERIYCCA